MENSRDIMANHGATGIATAILLISFILIAATVASVVVGNSRKSSEDDFEQTVNEIVDEISTYLQIKDVMGKYSSVNGEQRIQRLVILIKPLVSVNLDVSELMVKLCNGEQVRILSYSGQAAFLQSNSLFKHPLWDSTDENCFSLIVTLDGDRSMVDYHMIDDNTDWAYIIITLSEDFALKQDDSMEITLFSSTGIPRTITVEAPLPIKSLVNLL